MCVDGQKIAIRLSRRIAVVSKLLKKSLALHNSGIDASCHLLWNEAIEIYQDCLFDESSVPTVVKYQAVQLHHQICRSEEEIERIKTKMCDCVNHYIDVYEYLLKHAKIYEQSEHPLHLCDLGICCEEMYISVAVFTKLSTTYRIGTVAKCTDFIVWSVRA